MRYLEIYWLMVRNSLIREMNFKANFILWIVVELLWFLGQIVFLEVIYGQVNSIGGWSKWECVLLVGTNQVTAQIFQAFFYMNLSELPELIRTGRLDLMLLLPVDAQFAVSTRKFGMDNVLNAFVGLAIVAFSLVQLHLLPSPGQLLFYAAAVALGVAVHYSVLFGLSTLAFWIVRAQGLIYGYFNVFNIARYPSTVFPHGLFRFVFTFFIPVIIVANVPAGALVRVLERPWAGFGQLVVATIFIVCATRVLWLGALRRYSSTGS